MASKSTTDKQVYLEILLLSELIFATYYMHYLHAKPFLRNKTSYSQLKLSKPQAIDGGVSLQMP